MKKLNEDVSITDPQMAQQYANGQTQLTNMDKQINSLQAQINKIQQNKIQIQKKMDELAQQAAAKSQEQKPADQTQSDQAAVAAQAAAAAQAATAGATATSESLLIRVNEERGEEERINDEIDSYEDQLVYLMNNNGDRSEITAIKMQIRHAMDELRDLEMDQMDHEAEYDLDQYLDLGEHPMDEGYDDEEPRFSGMDGFPYELNKEGRPTRKIDPIRSKGTRKQKPWSNAKWEKYDMFGKDIDDIDEEIHALNQEITYQMERFQSPEDAEMEAEQFFGEIGFEASDILNSGISPMEKIKSLKKIGRTDASDLIDTYFYLYPEFDPSLDKPRKEADKEVKKLQDQIDKLEKKREKKEQQRDKMDESDNPMSSKNFYDLSEAYAEMEVSDRDEDEFIDKDYVFYVKIQDKGNEFIGKIFKVRPDGDWFGAVKEGEDDTFNKISYEPEYDEMDIVEFLRDSYDNIEIIDQHEFNGYIEDNDVDEEVIGGSNWPTNSIASR